MLFPLFLRLCRVMSVAPDLIAHPKIHSSEIRHEPDQPYEKAVAVKSKAERFLLFADHDGGPDSVGEHQPEGELSGERMRFEYVERTRSHLMHRKSTRHVEDEACPECSHVPAAQIARQAFGPDAERIEQECKGDENGCCCHGVTFRRKNRPGR